MTQKRLSNLVFSGVLVAVTGFWLWFLFAHADQIFRATQYLSRESERVSSSFARKRARIFAPMMALP